MSIKDITSVDIISKIMVASKIEDVLSIDNFKSEFNNIITQIHPDKCSLPDSVTATAKMNIWKDQFENGKEYKDDIGIFITNGYWADFNSKEQNLSWSIENYRLFQQLQSETDRHFLKYLPKECKLLQDGTYRFIFDKRTIPLSGLVLPQEHVNWILNRLLEYCSYLSEIGFSHCGLNPESVFIVPETHGIQVCSFYHLTKIGNRIGTISGKYLNWYPSETIADKTAYSSIDVELSKRIAAYLLGDKSGIGIKFRKTNNEDFINFILRKHSNSYECLIEYKALLKKNFKKEFHSLTI